MTGPRGVLGPSVDFNQLRTFVAVAREGNLTRASESLCLSQPAVSAQLKALEERLNLKLFERVARGMQITAAGRSLLREAEQAITAAQQVLAKAQHLQHGLSGLFRIGTIADPGILRLTALHDALSARYPDFRLSLHQGISGDIPSWIREGRIDAGFSIEPPDDERVEAMDVTPLTLRIVAPTAWADEIERRDWTGLATLPWITTPARCSFNRIAARMFARHGVNLQTTIEADQEHTLLSLVASGVGLTLVREDVALQAQRAGQVAIWRRGVEVAPLCFVYPRDKAQTPGVQAVLSAVREVWGLAPQQD